MGTPTTLRKLGKSGLALLFACAVVLNSAAVVTASDDVFVPADEPGYEDTVVEDGSDLQNPEDDDDDTIPEITDGLDDVNEPVFGAGSIQNDAGIHTGDVTVALGDEDFDLLDGVEAYDADANPIGRIDVADDGGFDVFVAGDYLVTYTATDPLTEVVYEATRRVTVQLSAVAAADFVLPGEADTGAENLQDLKDAIANAPQGTTYVIAVDSDITLDGAITVSADTNIHLVSADTSGPSTLYAAAGERHLVVDDSAVLTIADLVLDGGGAGGGVENAGTLYLLGGGTITNCLSDGRGGGVYSTGTVYIEEGSAVTDNTSGLYGASGDDGISIGPGVGIYDSAGGGIYAYEGDLYMRGGSISGNRTHSDANRSFGGGVSIYKGTFEMTGGTLEGNTAHSPATSLANNGITYGGGVYVDTDATFIIDGGQVLGNVGAGARSNYGAGVSVAQTGTLTLKRGAISGNYTVSSSENAYGGGVYIRSKTTFTMLGGEVSHNRAQAGEENSGGGVYIELGGTFHLSGGDIEYNAATHAAEGFGGGVYMKTGSPSGENVTSFTMDGGFISGNESTQGGGVYVFGLERLGHEYTLFTMKKGTISGNKAEAGGGVYMSGGVFTMSGGRIENNETKNAVSGFGSGVSVHGGTFELKGGTIAGNTGSARGGGVYVTDGTFLMRDGDIIQNNAAQGAGVYLSDSNSLFEMSGGTIGENTAPSGGAGVFMWSDAQFTMYDGTIADNRAAQGSGGGVNVYGGAFTMEGGDITGNYSGSNGGGIHVGDATVTVVDGLIRGNTAEWSGGGIHTDHADSALEIRSGSISYNRSNGAADAGHGGGGVSATTEDLVVSGGDFIGNEATGYGGGLRVENLEPGTVSISGATFTGNTAQSGGGISVFNDISQADIEDCAIRDNYAREYGGGIYADYWANVGVERIAFSGNTAGDGAYAFDMSYDPVLQTYNNQVKNLTSLSLPFDIGSSDDTMNKAYNNYDINYARGSHLGYTVTYRANGAEGTPPVDPKTYRSGDEVTVLGKGDLAMGDLTFLGWSTDPDATAAQYKVDDTFVINGSTTLYAVFVRTTTPYQFYVSYHANGAESGAAPVDSTPYGYRATVTVLGAGTLEKSGFVFLGWSEDASATTAQFTEGTTFDITKNTNLYAVFARSTTPLQFYVTYHANGAGGGTAPVDSTGYAFGSTVIVKGNTGNLEKSNHTFLGWSEDASAATAQYAGGDTFAIKGNTALYAVWKDNGTTTPPGPGPGTSYRITVEHWLYGAGETPANAQLRDTVRETVASGDPFIAQLKVYPDHSYQEGPSDDLVINAVSGDATIRIYYQFTGGNIGFGDELGTEVTVEVLDRRIENLTAMSWNEFVAATGLKLYVNGAVWEDATLASDNYDGVDFFKITSVLNHPAQTMDNPHILRVTARWQDAAGATQTTVGDITLRIVDTTPPDITVATNRVSYRRNSGPANEGALLQAIAPVVTDNHDDPMAFTVTYYNARMAEIDYSAIDWSATGEYGAYIDAVDISGNEAKREAVVISITARTSPPTNPGGGDNGGGDGDGGNYTSIGDNEIPYTQRDDGSWILDGDIPLEELPFTGSQAPYGFLPVLMATGWVMLHKCAARRRRRT